MIPAAQKHKTEHPDVLGLVVPKKLGVKIAVSPLRCKDFWAVQFVCNFHLLRVTVFSLKLNRPRSSDFGKNTSTGVVKL